MAKPELKDLVKEDVALFGSMKTEKERTAAIDKMEIGASDTTLNRRIAVYMWNVGRSSTGNAPAPIDGYLKAINAKMRGGTTGRPILSEKSFTTMASYYANFASLGFVKGWKTDTVLVWILDNVKGEYSVRGKFIKAVYALTEEPSEEELARLWKEAQNPPKLAGKATALVKAVKGFAAEDAFKPTLRDNVNVRAAYAKAVAACAAFEAAVKAGSGEEGDDDLLAEIMREAA